MNISKHIQSRDDFFLNFRYLNLIYNLNGEFNQINKYLKIKLFQTCYLYLDHHSTLNQFCLKIKKTRNFEFLRNKLELCLTEHFMTLN